MIYFIDKCYQISMSTNRRVTSLIRLQPLTGSPLGPVGPVGPDLPVGPLMPCKRVQSTVNVTSDIN